jgi:hypothetical protein
VCLAFAFLASACATPRQPAFEKQAEIAEAMNLYGPPMPAKKANEKAAQLVGKTILIEGYLFNHCADKQERKCMPGGNRFAVFSGDDLPSVTRAAHVKCPVTPTGRGPDTVLLGGTLPYSYAFPPLRRVLIMGTVSNRSESVPLDMSKFPGTYIDYIYDSILDDFKLLALYDDGCE